MLFVKKKHHRSKLVSFLSICLVASLILPLMGLPISATSMSNQYTISVTNFNDLTDALGNLGQNSLTLSIDSDINVVFFN